MKLRSATTEKTERRDLRNLEDLWGVLTAAELDKLKAMVKIVWGFISSGYLYLLVLVAVLPILCVIAAVFFHFQLGYDLPWIEIKNYQTAAHWGQVGDFVGGILNPLLSFVAFIAVLINLVMQRRDLALAREEARESNRTQKIQSKIFEKQNEAVERQNFESTFFRLLETHRQQFELAKVVVPTSTSARAGEHCFNWIWYKFLPKATFGVDPVEVIRGNAIIYAEEHSIGLSRYFKNLHQLLRFIDEFGSRSTLRDSALSHMRARKVIRHYNDQRVYANILRAQLSNDELCCIFLNCLTSKGAGMKYYVEKYSILKGIELPAPYANGFVKGLYSEIAYADSEDISKEQLRKVVSERYGSDLFIDE